MTATSPTIVHLHAAPVHQGWWFSPWRHHLTVVLALVLWGLLSSTGHADTCTTRTVKTESAPARSYTVDATPIQEVITTHKASVVWTGCTSGALNGGDWLAYFSSNFGTTWASYATAWGAPYYWNDERDTPTDLPFATSIRFLYDINCAVDPRTYCLDSMGNPVVTTLKSNSNHDSGLQMFVDVRFSARDDVSKKGCLAIGGGKEATWSVEGTTGSTVRAKVMPIALAFCTSLRMDLTLTIIKKKPFSIPGTDDVATINLTRNNNFKYSLCSVGQQCTAVTMLGAPFSVFDSGKPLTINLTKTVRPLPPTPKCVVQLQSAPTRSRL